MERSPAEVHGSAKDNNAFDDDIHLDQGEDEVTFSGATLELNISANDVNELDVKDSDSLNEDTPRSLNTTNNSAVENINKSMDESIDSMPSELEKTATLTRNRPFSASMASRTSVTTKSSVTSRTTMVPNYKVNDYSYAKFFSRREGTFDKKCIEAMDTLIKEDLDGKVLGFWLLIEIDSWDKENERIFITTERSLLIITYDFIKKVVIWVKRINLRRIDTVQIGDLTYTKGSMNTPRQNGAIRLSWETTSEVPSFGQRWNPFCTTMPYIIVSHHPIIYNDNEKETVLFNVDDFIETTVQAIEETYKTMAKFTLVKQGSNMQSSDELNVIEQPIEIQSYAGLLATIYNQSMLGFNRDRNGVCF